MRALDLTVDASLLWVGVGLALVAAVLLAFVPRLPSADGVERPRPVERQRAHHRRHRTAGCALFAVTQIAASFVLLAGAGMLLTTLLALQAAPTGFDTRNVLALNVPVMSYEPQAGAGRSVLQGDACGASPSCRASSASRSARPCRGATPAPSARASSSRSRATPQANGEEDPRARFRTVSPGFFAALGVPIIAGRDFNDADRRDAEQVVIVSQSLAQRMFPNQDAVNRHLMWTDPVMKFIDVSTKPRRIVGVAADVDDENIVPGRR